MMFSLHFHDIGLRGLRLRELNAIIYPFGCYICLLYLVFVAVAYQFFRFECVTGVSSIGTCDRQGR